MTITPHNRQCSWQQAYTVLHSLTQRMLSITVQNCSGAGTAVLHASRVCRHVLYTAALPVALSATDCDVHQTQCCLCAAFSLMLCTAMAPAHPQYWKNSMHVFKNIIQLGDGKPQAFDIAQKPLLGHAVWQTAVYAQYYCLPTIMCTR